MVIMVQSIKDLNSIPSLQGAVAIEEGLPVAKV